MSAQPEIFHSSGRLHPDAALRLNALILLSFLAASTAPSPLYGLYQEAWGFSPLTLTIIFSSYALALLAALLIFNNLSDHRGRREVILVSLAIEWLSMLLFFAADSVGWLITARVFQGVATGIATAVLSAALIDLHKERGAILNTVAPMVGLAIGALGASMLIQWAPAPMQLVFATLMVVFALLAVGAFYLPETATPHRGAWRSLKPSFAVPAAARAMMWRIVPINTAQWALGGFYLSLGPTLAQSVTRSNSALIGGALIAVVMFGSAFAIVLTNRRPPYATLVEGAAGLAVGVTVTLAAVQTYSTELLFVGAAISGFGFGTAFIGSIRCLVPLATPLERAGLLSAFYVVSYLAFSLPAIAAGWLAGRYGLERTAIIYGLVLILMTAAAWLVLKLRSPASVASKS